MADDCRAMKVWGLELIMKDGGGGIGPGKAKGMWFDSHLI